MIGGGKVRAIEKFFKNKLAVGPVYLGPKNNASSTKRRI